MLFTVDKVYIAKQILVRLIGFYFRNFLDPSVNSLDYLLEEGLLLDSETRSGLGEVAIFSRLGSTLERFTEFSLSFSSPAELLELRLDEALPSALNLGTPSLLLR